MVQVQGTCDERFAGVRDAFAANFDQGLDVGASVAVVHEGELVVDLWAGSADDGGHRAAGSGTRSPTSGRRPRP